MKNKLRLVVIVVFVFLLVGYQTSFAILNDDIADTALGYDGEWGDQCKEFVRTVIEDLGGSLGGGYTDCYDPENNEVDEENAVRGDIIQLCLDSDPEVYYTGMHTAIVLTNNGDGTFSVVDSNWCANNCEIVSVHSLNPSTTATYYGLQVHYYRLGTLSDSWDFNENYDDEGWTRTHIEGYSVNSGIYYIDPDYSDPYITSPTISANSEKGVLIIRMASNASDGNGAVYFTTSSEGSFSESKKETFDVENDGYYYNYCVPMKLNENWEDTITALRIDPADYGVNGTGSDTIGINYIYLANIDWDFNTTGNTDGWTMTHMEGYSVGGGIFYIDPDYSDPYITSTTISKDASEYSYIYIRMASNAPDGNGAIYFKTSTQSYFSESKKVEFDVDNDGDYHDYFIYMGDNGYWDDIITQIRIDPADYGVNGTNSDTIGIDIIHTY